MKNVVVLGGGFSGSYVAKKLEHNFYVTLIDTKDYFEFTPGILRTIVSPSHIKKIQSVHTHYLKKAKVIKDNVINVNDKEITLKDKKITFDYLVICTGSRYEFPFKSSNIVSTRRAHDLRGCFDDLKKADNILIVGGGIVGVEMAGEI